MYVGSSFWSASSQCLHGCAAEPVHVHVHVHVHDNDNDDVNDVNDDDVNDDDARALQPLRLQQLLEQA